eukprot:c13608_g1_i1 orf=477-1130(+)
MYLNKISLEELATSFHGLTQEPNSPEQFRPADNFKEDGRNYVRKVQTNRQQNASNVPDQTHRTSILLPEKSPFPPSPPVEATDVTFTPIRFSFLQAVEFQIGIPPPVLCGQRETRICEGNDAVGNCFLAEDFASPIPSGQHNDGASFFPPEEWTSGLLPTLCSDDISFFTLDEDAPVQRILPTNDFALLGNLFNEESIPFSLPVSTESSAKDLSLLS